MQNPNELLSVVLEARAKADELEQEFAQAKKVREEAERRLIEHMETSGIPSFKSDKGVLVSKKEKLYATPKKDRKEDVLRWVDEECGRSDLIQKSVPSKTFTSFIRQKLTDREAVPADLVNFYFKPILSISKS